MNAPFETRASVRSLIRACAAASIAAFDRSEPSRVVAREFSRDADAHWLIRASSEPPAMLTDTPALVRQIMPEFVSTLHGWSAAAKLFKEGLQLSFDGAGVIAVPSLLGDFTHAAFVAEGAPIPVVQRDVEPLVFMRPYKLSVIVVLTAEMIRSSNLEALVLDALKWSTALTLDSVMLDDQGADAARPAGIRYGVAPLTASTAPDPSAALLMDIEAARAAVADVTPTHPIYLMSATHALMSELRSPHGLAPLTVMGSLYLKGTNLMIAATPENIASVFEGAPTVTASRQAALQMSANLAPGDPVRSMFQTDCVALLVKLPVTWCVRSQRGVSWMVTTNW